MPHLRSLQLLAAAKKAEAAARAEAAGAQTEAQAARAAERKAGQEATRARAEAESQRRAARESAAATAAAERRAVAAERRTGEAERRAGEAEGALAALRAAGERRLRGALGPVLQELEAGLAGPEPERAARQLPGLLRRLWPAIVAGARQRECAVCLSTVPEEDLRVLLPCVRPPL
eukprot:tig00000404_g409.t1